MNAAEEKSQLAFFEMLVENERWWDRTLEAFADFAGQHGKENPDAGCV